MQLHELLFEKKGVILEKWINSVLSCYPADTQRFFKKQEDRFANPLGYNINDCLTKLYSKLGQDLEVAEAANILENFIKIRATQGLLPSQAIGFIFELKKLVRAECLTKPTIELHQEIVAVEEQIDGWARLAYDLYLADRELLYQVRINEIKRGTHILTEGAVCPSALMRQNLKKEKELQPINTISTTEAR